MKEVIVVIEYDQYRLDLESMVEKINELRDSL